MPPEALFAKGKMGQRLVWTGQGQGEMENELILLNLGQKV